jgi:hypothetical protein
MSVSTWQTRKPEYNFGKEPGAGIKPLIMEPDE